jgi:hypothetical protein
MRLLTLLLALAACGTSPEPSTDVEAPPMLHDAPRDLLTDWHYNGAPVDPESVGCIDFADDGNAYRLQREADGWPDLLLGAWALLDDDFGDCGALYLVDGDEWAAVLDDCEQPSGFVVEVVSSDKPRHELPPSLVDYDDVPGFEVALDCSL